MNEGIAKLKQSLRLQVRTSRAGRSPIARKRASNAVNDLLRELATQLRVRSIAAFFPTETEPDVTEFLDWALHENIIVYVPVSRPDGLMDWTQAQVASPTHRGLHNMPEATGEHLAPETLGSVDLILAPAAAVDIGGVRLGWGRGYFDRTLARVHESALSRGTSVTLPPMFAVVFDDEVMQSLPREPHDVLATGAVSPQGIRWFTSSAAASRA